MIDRIEQRPTPGPRRSWLAIRLSGMEWLDDQLRSAKLGRSGPVTGRRRVVHYGGLSVIPYVGLPITPDTVAVAAVQAGHAFVSKDHPEQLDLAIEVCQSFAVDNGAFSAWKRGTPVKNWSPFYQWVEGLRRAPNCDFAVIPDVIDGGEPENDAVLREWPFPKHFGAPVWHMHESLDRLVRLAVDYPRICLGSSGEYSVVGNSLWWRRINLAMLSICDPEGFPITKLHGLRMLNPKVFTRLPLASADSTNIARNVGIDKNWSRGNYPVPTKSARATVMRLRLESNQASKQWVPLSPGELS